MHCVTHPFSKCLLFSIFEGLKNVKNSTSKTILCDWAFQCILQVARTISYWTAKHMVLYGSKWHVKIMWKRATVLVSPMFFQYTKGRSSAFHKPICGKVCRSAVASTVLWTGGTMQEASLILEGFIPLGPQNLRMHANVTNAKKNTMDWHMFIVIGIFRYPLHPSVCVCTRQICQRKWWRSMQPLLGTTARSPGLTNQPLLLMPCRGELPPLALAIPLQILQIYIHHGKGSSSSRSSFWPMRCIQVAQSRWVLWDIFQ